MNVFLVRQLNEALNTFSSCFSSLKLSGNVAGLSSASHLCLAGAVV